MPTFDELLAIGDSGKRTSVESVSLNQDVKEAQAVEEHQRDVQKVRQREDAISRTVAQNIKERQALRSQWGTDDPKKIAVIKASGVFAGDLAANMQIDPEGTRARVEQALSIIGKGGVQDMVDDVPAAPDRTYYRQNEKGTLEFTNIPSHATDEGWRRYNSDSGRHKDLGAPGGDVSQVSEGAVGAQSAEDILFQGKVDEARAIVERPEREEKRAQAAEKYFDELWGKHDDIRGVRQQLQDDWFSGAAKARGLQPRDVKALDAIILKRGRKITEMTDPGIDKTFFKPWVKGRPGQAASQAEPASVVNPGGGTSETTKVAQRKMLSAADADAAMRETLPVEQPTTYQYARGTASPQPRETPSAPKSPTPLPGSHLATLEGPNPVDEFVESVAAPTADFLGGGLSKPQSPDEALRKRQRDFGGIGF